MYWKKTLLRIAWVYLLFGMVGLVLLGLAGGIDIDPSLRGHFLLPTILACLNIYYPLWRICDYLEKPQRPLEDYLPFLNWLAIAFSINSFISIFGLNSDLARYAFTSFNNVVSQIDPALSLNFFVGMVAMHLQSFFIPLFQGATGLLFAFVCLWVATLIRERGELTKDLGALKKEERLTV